VVLDQEPLKLFQTLDGLISQFAPLLTDACDDQPSQQSDRAEARRKRGNRGQSRRHTTQPQGPHEGADGAGDDGGDDQRNGDQAQRHQQPR
jgi:hypothetical protein